MLKFKVKEILLASGKKNPVKWLINHCDMPRGKAYSIYSGRQKTINPKDFSKLCENLNCTPNDLMYWEQTPQTRLPDDHPCITQLKKPDKNSDWFELFKNLTPDKIIELHQKANEMAKRE